MRVLAALAAGTALMCLAACGSGTGDSGGTAAGPSSDISAGKVGTVSEFVDISTVCGTKPITVGYADGFGGNSWRKTSKAELEAEAAKCPSIQKVIYTDGQGNPQKAISDIDGLIAQKVDVLIVYPDAGDAMLPAMRKAKRAGITVIPWATGSLTGQIGRDYDDVVTDDTAYNGEVMATWMAKALNGKGNVVYLGGTPGNPTSASIFEGVKKGLAGTPDIKLLVDRPVDTNWDPAQSQKVMAGLLTQYDKIDGVFSDFGGGSVGAMRAFTAANRPLVPWTGSDGNDFACQYQQLKGANPAFQLASVDSRNWLIRTALRKGVAAKQGLPDPEPSIVRIELFEDSLDPAKAPRCDTSLPADAILSTHLDTATLKTLFATTG